jgi:hypothetical protein
MKHLSTISIFLCIAISSFPQSTAPSPPTSVYAESFRQGSTRVVDEHFDLKLTPHDPTYRERIKDFYGNDRFALSITPKGPEGDTEITSWLVTLADLQHTMYNNVLLTSQEASSDPKDALWRLNPTLLGSVPVAAKRIIKVESFYVVLQIKAYHFSPPDSPYLDSMTVGVEFTNTDPRTNDTRTAETPATSK